MSVRPAALHDARRVAEIHVRAWQRAYRGLVPDAVLSGLSIAEREEFWRKRLSADTTGVLVFAAPDAIRGWLAYGPTRDADATAAVREIYGLYVDPTAWRQGHATELCSAACGRLRDAGKARVTLWVIEANVPARRFYESAGFELDHGHTKRVDRSGAVLDEVRYYRTL